MAEVASMDSADEGLWDAARVAKFLGVSKWGVYRYARMSMIPCVRILGGRVRFRPSDIRAIVATGLPSTGGEQA